MATVPDAHLMVPLLDSLIPIPGRRGQPRNRPASSTHRPHSLGHWCFRNAHDHAKAALLSSPHQHIDAVRIARHAEAAGLESLWTGEHIVLPDPQPAGFSIPPTLPFVDTVVALTLLAAHTAKIKLGSGIIELPLHHPVILAKQLASIDIISQGRLIVGVGAGYVGADFEAIGIPLAERGSRMDESSSIRGRLTYRRRSEHRPNLMCQREVTQPCSRAAGTTWWTDSTVYRVRVPPPPEPPPRASTGLPAGLGITSGPA